MQKVKRIYFSGLDGSGKSTATEKLQQHLQKKGLKVAKLHFYYNYIYIKIQKKISPKKIENSSQSQYLPKRKKNLKNKIWTYFVVLDGILQFLFFELINFNKIKIYDRFFQDYLVSFKYLNLESNFLLDYICKKTNCHFLILADPEVAFNRNPEHSIEFFKECHQYYLDLQKQYQLEYINTSNQNPEQVLNKILTKYELLSKNK